MAWIRLILVVFCIYSIYGLPQDIANPSDDLKPSDLTKNPIENPSSVDPKPSDLTEIVVFAMKLYSSEIHLVSRKLHNKTKTRT